MPYIGKDIESITFNSANNLNVVGNITLSGTVDGRDVATDGTKLDTVATNAIANLSEDTTPQLGGNLDLNTNNVIGTGNINVTGSITGTSYVSTGDMAFTNNSKAKFGTSPSLEIFHDGSNSILNDVGAGNFKMQLAGSDKLEVTSTGVSVTGTTEASVFKVASGQYFDTSGGNVRINNINNADILFRTGSSGTERMRILSDGKVGIGTAPDRDLHVKGASGDPVHFKLEGDASDYARIMFDDGTDDNIGEIRYDFGSDFMQFTVNAGEAFRVDSSKNLLIGKTALGTANDGLQVKPAGELVVTRDGNHSFILNRKSSDGNIALFQKDGTTVGSIGSLSGRMYAGSGDVGVFFDSTNNMITPYSIDAGDTVDNTIDLGYSSRRFKDGYFSGTLNCVQIRGVSDTNTGIDVTGSDIIGFKTGGSERVRIDNTGRVSIHPDGTAFFGESSADNLNIYQTGANVGMTLRSDNDRAIGIYFADGDSGDDLFRGYIQYNHANELFDFAGQGAVRLIAGGNEKVRVLTNSTPHLLVGCTSTPSSSVAGTAISTTAAGSFQSFAGTTNTSTHAAFGNTNGVQGTIRTTASATQYNTSSDRRLKSNIQNAASASSKIDAIQVRQFDWNADNFHQDYGLIAQELQPIEPLAVTGDANSDEMMGVDYSKLVPMLIKEIQELRNRIAIIENK